MTDLALAQALSARYPITATLPDDARAAVLAHEAQELLVPAGATVFDEGSPCQGFPLVLDGEITVARSSAQGRTLELYRVGAGDICVASTACVFGQRPMLAQGVATQPTRLLILSAAGFDAWCMHAPFRQFVFGVFAERFADLMALIEAVAFQRLDQRLAAALLGHGSVLHTSHQALADQLGTVREIVTRLLKQFERSGWVRLARERIDIVDAAGLRSVGPGDAAA